LKPQFTSYFGGKFAGWLDILRQPLSWPLLIVALYLFLAPNIDFAFHLDSHDGQRIAQLAAIGLSVLVLLVSSRVRMAFEGTWTHLPLWSRLVLAAVFVLGLVSALQAPLPRWALLEWGISLLLLVAAFTVAAARRELGDSMDILLVLLCFGTALAYAVTSCCIYIAMLLVSPAYGLGFDMRELYTGFSNIRFFGYVQTMLLPFLLLPALYWGVTRVRCLLLCLVPAIWWMLAIGSGTRGTWVALTVGILAVLWFGGSYGRRWALWQSGGFLGGLVFYVLLVLGLPQLFELQVSFLHRTGDIISLSLREVIWSLAVQFSSENPWFGIGPMHFAYWKNEVAAHPHNAVLQWFAEWGVPAGLLLAGLWVSSGFALAEYTRRMADQREIWTRYFRAALLAALTGASAQAMVDGVMVMPVSQMLLALLAGWAVGMMHCSRLRLFIGSVERVLLLLSIVFAVIVVIFGIAPEIGNLAERQKTYLEGLQEGARLLPRFWTQGWIGS